jgi:hypothetical protein
MDIGERDSEGAIMLLNERTRRHETSQMAMYADRYLDSCGGACHAD